MNLATIRRHCILCAGAICLLFLFPLQAQESTNAATLKEREAAVRVDLEEAVQMLDKKQYLFFAADFLARESRPTLESRRFSDRDVEQFSALRIQLQSALDAKPTFNRTRTLAQLDYVLKPVEQVPEKPPENVPALFGDPQGSTTGFGADLSTALYAAVGNLDEGRIEPFIRGMYPIAELSRLTQGDQLDRLKFRLTRNPEMIRAMIRDLKQAASEKAGLSEENGIKTAIVTLPPISEQAKPRSLKFELVDGHWRFFDFQRDERKAHEELMSAPIAGYSIPGSKLTLMLVWEVDSWKLMSAPVVQSIDE